MPLAQAHPFEPMPVTHEEEMQEGEEAGSGADKQQQEVAMEHETEYSLAQMMANGSIRKADPSQFELLKVLGQGSFGKVSHTTRGC
jgi:p90 ribosomal S6 kinase